MNCPNCGGSVPPGMSRCGKCGSFIEQAAPQVPLQAPSAPLMTPAAGPAPAAPGAPAGVAKSKIAAGLLGIFLGGLGVHNFYLGKIGFAVTQLILTVAVGWFTCGISAIAASVWGLIEGILILTGTIDRDGDGRPLV